jgi:CDP-paratose 2-epimerase
MKVLVTGGCGFLGYHLCMHFRAKGAGVMAYDNLAKHEFARIPYMCAAARDFNLYNLQEAGVEIAKEDIRDAAALIRLASDCDFICHTAAQPAMTIACEDPRLDFSTNVLGTFNVLEAARAAAIPVAICSSIHTFGPDAINGSLTEERTRYVRTPVALSEGEPLLQGAVTPLHASKRTNEIYVQSFIDTYKLAAACFRLTGIYGPNQFGGEDHGWVANFAIRALLGLPLTIFGSGKQLRDILYATDAARAFEAFYLAQKPGIYNIGGGTPTMISLLECIAMIERLTGKKADVRFADGRFGDLRYFVTDHRKFTDATGWQPTVRPEDGISALLAWAQANAELFSPSQVVVNA